MNTNLTNRRWSTIALSATATATLAIGAAVGYAIGHATTPAPSATTPVATPAQESPAAMSKDAAGVEATIRDEFRTLYQGSITKEQWQHYCNDLITAESRSHVTGCEAPKDDYMGHKDEIRRIENIVIDGDKATATVDYHTVLYGGGDATIQETLYWEDGRWKLDSRMRNDR